MSAVMKEYIKVKRRADRVPMQYMGQTMTEYALILAAVAIVAYITYQVMGQDIGSMVNGIDNALSAA